MTVQPVGVGSTRPMLALTLLLCFHRANSQGSTTQELSSEMVSVSSTLDSQQEGWCQSSAVSSAGPVTIYRYAGGEALVTSDDEIARVRSQINQLANRITELETKVSQLLTGEIGKGTEEVSEDKPPSQRLKDCDDVRANGSSTNGVYTIWPLYAPKPISALCTFNSDASFTVIQAREGVSVDFQRSWGEYQKGFGTLALGQSFWWGLDSIHYLTNQGVQYKLRVVLGDWDRGIRTADYDFFSVGPETDLYRLKIYFYNELFSTAGDAFGSYHNYAPFSTFDFDNDYSGRNCPVENSGGWWFRDCDNANLNGFNNTARVLDVEENGIEWDTWRPMYSLYRASMSLYRAFAPTSSDNFP